MNKHDHEPNHQHAQDHDHDQGHGHAHASHDHAHDHGHVHLHSHAHGHHHAHAIGTAGTGSRAFAIGIALNLAFVGVEGAAGLLANSVALLADAGHNLSDVLGLALAWIAIGLGRRKPSPHFTYGLRGSSIWAALANASLLLVACGGIAWEAVDRIIDPRPVEGVVMMVVAAIGVVINTVTALLFMRGSRDDLNVRGAFLHMAADAAISLGVVVAGALVLTTGWLWLDPTISLVIVAVILAGTWGLLKDAARLALQAVPPAIEPAAVLEWLASRTGVTEVHDLHIWAISTTEIALTAHLVIPGERPADLFYSELSAGLEEHFGIRHPTLQIECGDGTAACKLAPSDVV